MQLQLAVASRRHRNAVGLDRVSRCVELSLEGQQPGGVEQEGVEVLGVNGPVQRRLGATPLDFWQQVLHLLNGHQDLTRGEQK